MLEVSRRDIFDLYMRCAVSALLVLLLVSCSSGGGDDKGGSGGGEVPARTFAVKTNVSGNGNIRPSSATPALGGSQTFTLTPGEDNQINSIDGCGGALTGNTYTIADVKSDCTISVRFLPSGLYVIQFRSDENGRFDSGLEQLLVNGGFQVEITPDDGYIVDDVTGCGGELKENTYTVQHVSENCIVEASFKKGSYLTVVGDPIKGLKFSWGETPGATHYQLFELAGGEKDFVQIGEDISTEVGEYDHEIPVHKMKGARYRLRVCTNNECILANTVEVTNPVLVDSIGYLKASNADSSDRFGQIVKISSDGSTLAVAAPNESSSAKGVDGDQFDNSAADAGAVYIFSNKGGEWLQEAYIKARNAEAGDYFGSAIDLSADGSILVVGAHAEASSATEINGNESDNSAPEAGAVYVFTRDNRTWRQQAYLKANTSPKPGYILEFGRSLALDSDGDTLAVGSLHNKADQDGPVHIFRRSGDEWRFDQIVRPALAGDYDNAGASLELSADGHTLAFGAPFDRSAATGVNGDEADSGLSAVGAAYIFNYLDGTWIQKAYIKSSNPEENDFFGYEIALSEDGMFFAVGVDAEDSPSIQTPNSSALPLSGSVYVYQLVNNDWKFLQMLKASNAAENYRFGSAISFNADGSLLAVGADFEGSSGAGLEAGESEFFSRKSGAVYLFTRNQNSFEETSFIKAKNAYGDAMFGCSLSLSADGDTLAVGAAYEDGGSTGIGGDLTPFGGNNSGAVYLY